PWLLFFDFQYGEFPLQAFLFPAAFFFASGFQVLLHVFAALVLFDNILILFYGLLLIFLLFQHCFVVKASVGFQNLQRSFYAGFLPGLFVIVFFQDHFSTTI